MRTRSESAMASATYRYYQTDVSCALLGTRLVDTGIASKVGTRKWMQDDVTQRFRQRSESGEIIVNPMSSYSIGVSAGGDNGHARSTAYSCGTKYGYWDMQGPWIGIREGSNDPNWYPPYRACDATATSRIIEETVTAMWAESSAHDANLYVGLAELAETIGMLRKPLSSIQKLLGKAVRKQRKKTKVKGRVTSKEYREAVTGTWMEARYGWRPFISEISGVLKALEKPQGTARKFYRKSSKKEFSTTATVVHDFGSWTTTYRRDTTETVVCRAGMVIDDEVSLARALGLDLSGLLVVPWEVIPASFVLDWVANVGNYLSAIGAYATRKPTATWYTLEKTIVTSVYPVTTVPVAGRLIVRNPNDRIQVVLVEKNRIKNAPPPSLTIKADWAQFKSVQHTIDLAIILSQKLKLR